MSATGEPWSCKLYPCIRTACLWKVRCTASVQMAAVSQSSLRVHSEHLGCSLHEFLSF